MKKPIVAARPQLHVSALNMLSFCGEQFRRRYIEKEKTPPGIALIVGTATDKSVTANLQNKITNDVLLEDEQIRDTARDAVLAEWDRGVKIEAGGESALTQKGEAVDKAVRLSSAHGFFVAPLLEPTHVQFEFEVVLPGYPVNLAGAMDVREATTVRDTKTMAKSKTQADADLSLQLTMYSYAVKLIDGKAPEKLTLDCLVDTKLPKSLIIETTRSEEDFEILMRRVETAIVIIEKGAFMPVKNEDPLCSPKFCGYYDSCKYVKKPVSISV